MVFLSVSEKPNKFRKDSKYFLEITYSSTLKWIQKGCGDEEYYCEEKGAVFTAANMPDKCPDLSEHK